MDLTEILTITGQPGLFKLVGQKGNGIIVSDLQGGKKRFVSTRQHLFTPLENITVYTELDTIALKDVFAKMKKNETEHPPVSVKSSGDEIRSWFTTVVPEHDAERVYQSDIKKIIRWYNELDQQGFINLDEVEEEKAEKKTE